MEKLLKYILLVFILGLLPCNAFAVEKIFYMSHSKKQDGIKSLQKYSDKIDILAPQFYGITEDLRLVGGIDEQLKKIITEKKVKVMPLIANAGFKQKVIHDLLVSEKAQNEIIKNMVDIAKKENYVGWQFDFENISYKDKDLFSAFVEKTAKVMHENGLILSIAAVARYVDYEDTDHFKNWSGVFDYERLAKALDFISLMTYDDPKSVGPVASLPYINNVLNYVKDKVPSEKLSLGIPLYNWGWRTEPFKKITSNGTHKGLLYIMSNFSHKLGFDSSLGASWLTYFYNNKQYQIWYQSKRTFEARIDIIEQNKFKGFSAWVLGVEDPEIWVVLDKSN